jgi:amino acid adenylation domain-containing protein
MKNGGFIITEKLLESFKKFSKRTAFFTLGVTYTYYQFKLRVSAIQKHILSVIPDEEKYIGLLSHDHPDTYASIFALWFCGKAFVPLNPFNPEERNQKIIRQMNIRHILSANGPGGLIKETKKMVISTKNMIDDSSEILINDVSPDTDAYVLFTSGSTGIPKGVRINRGNLDSFYRSYIAFGPEYTESDRFLQIYDISFDGSVPCYIIPLCAGASVYTVPQDEIKYLYAFKLMKDHDLTVVKMTPSTLHYLRPYFYCINLPMVRHCLFGGEALQVSLLEEWMNCVPNSHIQNVYGPTEATVDSLMYNFNSGPFQKKVNGGVVSLGKSFGDFEYAVVNSSGTKVTDGEIGELCLNGLQVMSGYWNDEEKTDKAFIGIKTANGDKNFYRTGDLVFKDPDGFFMYIGRIDNQVQVQGYRVELGEIEKHARDFLNGINLLAVTCRNLVGNTIIALFIEGDEMQQQPIMTYLDSLLPKYMLPSKIIFMKDLHRGTSGKTDRLALSKMADEYGEK